MSTLPPIAILIVPGSFTYPDLYNPITDPITARGYEIKTIALRSAGPAPGQPRENNSSSPPTLYDDAAYISAEIEKLADQGKHVILIGHSYGGAAASESVRGLRLDERRKQGKPGGIARLAYITSLVPAVGRSAAEVMQDTSNGGMMVPDENGWLHFPSHAETAAISFSDLPPDEGIAWVGRFSLHSAAAFGTPLTHAGYTDVPVEYLICELDRAIPAKVQRDGIALIEQVSGRKVRVASIQAGHVPMASKLEETIEWFVGLVERTRTGDV
ncbi:Alpha/beta hydrolase fold-1 [Bombardia bombarda]|uniref:Alpha/beta hydrolase fold-1 n=1 Tax=Bombardia bombarda TaxID=252184 RepID=A0AA39X193_9PEZI|nr:Alpha/beta hydrolase fold-1 [Bombardia bombarda]